MLVRDANKQTLNSYKFAYLGWFLNIWCVKLSFCLQAFELTGLNLQ